ncbi:hypothetical protein [Vibrio phage phiKT1028]|nr:hypothetical protein [Vibrio phage phiKT1028]
MIECNPAEELAFNLERRDEWQRSYPLLDMKAYQGPFVHLDLSQTWFCPRCCDLSKPLQLNATKTALYCTESDQVCEYSYANFEERKRRGTFLSHKYSLPLTLEQGRDFMLNRVNREIENMQRQRESLDTRIEEKQDYIIKLKRSWE